MLEELQTIAPLFAVRGNIDTRARAIPDVLVIDFTDGERDLRILLTHIAVAGTRVRADVARMARTAGAGLIVCGHSHIPFITREGDLTLFNPGSVGPKRFHLPILFGTIEVSGTGVRLSHFDCETGKRWTPPG